MFLFCNLINFHSLVLLNVIASNNSFIYNKLKQKLFPTEKVKIKPKCHSNIRLNQKSTLTLFKVFLLSNIKLLEP